MSSVTSSSSSTNVTRITGMATGMDTDAMVKAMTANYQTKIDKMSQDKQIVEWKQEMYRDIIKDIKGLQDYFDVTSSKYILGESKFNPIKTTNSNESAVQFTASSTAEAGNYKITVNKLSEPAIVKNNAVNKSDSTLSTKLKDINAGFGGNINFEISATSGTTTTSKTVSVAVGADTTIQNVIDTINADSNIKNMKVTASFDELSKKIVFKTDNTGVGEKLAVTVTNANANDLGFVSGTKYEDLGQNADFSMTYPDGRVENNIVTQTTNQFTANGITYNLKSVGSADITVSKNNVDSVVDNLKKFIDDYNGVIGKIQSKLTEKKQYSYKPLTDEQKENMKDDDIEKWETKAKQGILKNDDYLEGLLGDLRGTFSSLVYSDKTTDTKNSFHIGVQGSGAIGLDTSRYLDESGKIFIKDETKLKNAISNNIEDVTKFFIGKSSEKLGTNDRYIGSNTYYEDGLFTRMDKIIRDYAGDPGIGKDGTSTLKGSLNIFANKQYDYSMTGGAGKNTMPDQMYAKALSIEEIQKKMNEAQNRYYEKFAKLESAMNEMNAQMSNLQSQMGF